MRGRSRKSGVLEARVPRAVAFGLRHQGAGALPTAKRLKDVLVIAEERGLLRGARTKVVRGRLPEALVSSAKTRSGIKSDTALLEAALANLAVGDDYPEWLLSRTGTVNQDIDLEF